MNQFNYLNFNPNPCPTQPRPCSGAPLRRWGLGAAYRGLGVVAQLEGQHQQALIMFGKSLDTFSELGGNWWMARVLAETGRSLLELGNHLEAGRVWRKSLRIATETHSTPVVLGAFLDLASLQARQGDLEEALEWLLIVLAHPASFEETRQRGEQLRTELEAQLTSRQIEAAQARAQCTSFKAAIATILQGKSAGHRYMPN